MSSSSSHKRRRWSQQDIRKLYGSQGTSESHPSHSSESVKEPNNKGIAKASTASNTNDNRTSVSLPSSHSSLPFSTPNETKKKNQEVARTSQDEPSTFCGSATASDLSTIPSTVDPLKQASPNTSHAASSLIQLSSSRPNPETEAVIASSATTNRSNNEPSVHTRISSSVFNLWHRRGSVGLIEFGTQSLPPKKLNLLPAIERSARPVTTATENQQLPDRTTNTEVDEEEIPTLNPQDDVSILNPTPLEVAIPTNALPDPNEEEEEEEAQTNEAPAFRLTKAPPKVSVATAQKSLVSHQQPVNLRGHVKNVTEGAFLLQLRRIDPLPCKYPGRSTKLNAPLVVVTAEADKRKRNKLSLVSNNCSLMMRRAKNYTSGVSRSPTGTSKQKRFDKEGPSKKRKHQNTTSSDPDSKPSGGNPSLQLVTSFALRTLVLEDLWFVQEGLPIVLFFHDESLPPRYSKKWQEIWEESLQSDYIPSVQCQGRTYKQLVGWVHGNPDVKHVTGDGKRYENIVEALSEFQQHALQLKFPVISPFLEWNLTMPPKHCLQEKLGWFEYFHFPQSIFLQADYHPERRWQSIFKMLKADTDDRVTLLHRLIQETQGDRFMLSELRGIWERLAQTALATKTKEENEKALAKAVEEATSTTSQLNQPLIVPDVVEAFCSKVDATLVDRLESCFGRFNNIFDMILSEYETRCLVMEFERALPQQFEAIMSFCGYNKKLQSVPANERDFVRLRYTLDAFFQFVVRSRNHNNHLLVPFATIFALAQYACGHPLFATQIPVWFGISVSKRTMERRIESWMQSYDERLRNSLKNVTFLMGVFDNLQDGRALQFQQGQSAIYTRVTARFIMQMYLAKFPAWAYSFTERPILTYIAQDIPAPYQLPALEFVKPGSLSTLITSIFLGRYPVECGPAGSPFDCSGTRVRHYQQLYKCCRELGTVKRFLSTKRRANRMDADYTLQPWEFPYSGVRASINNAMNKLRKPKATNLFELAKQFPSVMVRTWRGEPPVADLLMLPVSVLDETTKVGASGIILDFMVLHGLLIWDVQDEMYKPADTWEDKWLFIVGDGLSIDRLFQFFDDVMAITDAKSSSFRAAYKQAISINQVLHRVVPINGDLHVRFHMLDSIFRLFYGGFLQCIQH